jgi:hypothetical protein
MPVLRPRDEPGADGIPLDVEKIGARLQFSKPEERV